VRDRSRREGVTRLLGRPRYEMIPLTGAEAQAAHIPAGSTVTVTSSPRRGMEPTLELIEHLAARGYRAVPHLSARLVEGPGHLREMVERLEAARIREIFVVGGDPDEPAGPYPSALSLLQALDEHGHGFEAIGVAGYPEPHPKIEDAKLLQALLEKRPFATYIVTQMCYSPHAIGTWLERVRAQGVTLPVHVGMPGTVARTKLLEISLRCGVGDSVRYLRKNAGIVARVLGGGKAFHPSGFVAELAGILLPKGEGRPLHLNTFNQVERTEQWRREVLGTRLDETAAHSSGERVR